MTSLTSKTSEHPIDALHRIMRTRDTEGLNALVAEDAVFHSPLQDVPQRGRAVVAGNLTFAFDQLSSVGFRYVRQIVGPSDAMLEFEATVDGVPLNGADLIKWDESGRIVDFKVMIRPLDALTAFQARLTAARSVDK